MFLVWRAQPQYWDMSRSFSLLEERQIIILRIFLYLLLNSCTWGGEQAHCVCLCLGFGDPCPCRGGGGGASVGNTDLLNTLNIYP